MEMDRAVLAVQSTLRSINEIGVIARSYKEQRSTVFKIVLTASLAACGFIFGVATSSIHVGSGKTAQMVALGMAGGSFLSIIYDVVMLWKIDNCISRGLKAERDTGSSINSFDLMMEGLLLNSRFIVCYFFILVLGGTILTFPTTFNLTAPL